MYNVQTKNNSATLVIHYIFRSFFFQKNVHFFEALQGNFFGAEIDEIFFTFPFQERKEWMI